MRRRKKPTEPLPTDCCGSGCSRCVWDVYYDQLEEWKKKKTTEEDDGNVDDEEQGDDDQSGVTTPSATMRSSYVGCVVVKYGEEEEEEDQQRKTKSSSTAAASSLVVEGKDISVAFATPLTTTTSVEVAATTTDLSSPHWDEGPPLVHLGLNLRLKKNKEGEESGEGDTSSSLSSSSSFYPGDVVEICYENNPKEVDALLERLGGLPPDRICHLSQSPFVEPNSFPFWLPEERPVTLHHLFSKYVDMTTSSFLRNPLFFSTLAKWCKGSSAAASQQREELTELSELLQHQRRRCSSIDHQPHSIFSAFPSLRSVLEAFSESKPPLARLLEVTTPLKPRKFSVANVPTCETEEITRREGTEEEEEGRVLLRVELLVRPVVAERRPTTPSPTTATTVTATAITDHTTTTTTAAAAAVGHPDHRHRGGGQAKIDAAAVLQYGPHFHGHVTWPLTQWALHRQQHHHQQQGGNNGIPSILLAPASVSLQHFGRAQSLYEKLLSPKKNAATTPGGGGMSSSLSASPPWRPTFRPLVMVGAGSGVAPLRSMIQYHLQQLMKLGSAASTAAATATSLMPEQDGLVGEGCPPTVVGVGGGGAGSFDSGGIMLLQGAKTFDELAFSSEWDEWFRSGALREVYVSISQQKQQPPTQLLTGWLSSREYINKIHCGIPTTSSSSVNDGDGVSSLSSSIPKHVTEWLRQSPPKEEVQQQQQPLSSSSLYEGVFDYANTTAAEKVKSILNEHDGGFIACGPSPMLRSVRSALQSLLSSGEEEDESVQEHRLLMLESDGRVVFEAWDNQQQLR